MTLASPPRVAILSGDLQPERCGIADYTERLASHLCAGGAEVAAVDGGRGRGAGAAWGLRDVVHLARALRRSAPDVVHLQFAPSAFAYRGAIGLLPAMLGGLPLVVTLHEYGWWSWHPARVPEGVVEPLWRAAEGRRAWDRETLLLAPRAARLVVTNARHLRTVGERLPGVRAPAVIPIGPNVEARPPLPEPARARVREELGASVHAPLLVFFGFVHPVKGVPYLLDATRELRRGYPELRLLVVGGFESLALRGEEARAWHREVEEGIAARGLERAVTLTGYRPEAEVSRLLRAADVAVLPFNQGATLKSGALLAALAHGVPTVTTWAAPPDPALEDGHHALLVPRRDPTALAAAVERVLTRPELARRLAAGGPELAAAHGWEGLAAAHLELYREVLARGVAA